MDSSTSANSTQALSLEEMTEKVRALEVDHVRALAKCFTGIRIIVDPTGMACGKNGYALIVGEKLYERLLKQMTADELGIKF